MVGAGRKSAKHASKEPVLIYKFDRQPITVVMRLAYVMKAIMLYMTKKLECHGMHSHTLQGRICDG